ncbi:MAG: type VI secretion system baseplate subunit TssF [Pyrinomonadaceae bacterium]|nr:type VI secretion system baseplate subunit TssF [Pyrinomonadaceae bacterium]MCX7639070.1 type VI secretion system baseplate subunit TssF [Pyrinomonadaceae bacterium]MDW8303709.1 type VI secretion system baseplate subunit TssF [Acidobacteriota bacterium]
MRDELLGFYERELFFLRRMGAEFARRYPKIASRLLLDEEKTEDPHVERIIEAFAFLAARIQLKLADEFPEITESFLNVLYPHYLSPIPSMAIVQFVYGNPNDKLTTAQKLPRGTSLYSRSVEGVNCRFRTCYETILFPLEVTSAALESDAPPDSRGKLARARLRISFRCYGNAQLSELRDGQTNQIPRFIRFYLNDTPQIVYPLYEFIFNNAVAVEFKPKDPPVDNKTFLTMTGLQLKLPDPVILSADCIKQVGFSEEEAMLPYTKRSFPGYRLLTEYFAFPYKFLFFDVYGLDEAVKRKFGTYFDLIIHLKDITLPVGEITAQTFVIGASPVVNLFQQTADPIYLSQQKYEYHLIADVHHQRAVEIYSVDEVFATDPKTGSTRIYSPFYSIKHSYEDVAEKSFWYASRRASQRENDKGTEVFLSFVDLNFNPKVPAEEVITVKVTCTNRDLPAKLPFGGKGNDFEVESPVILSRVRCLTKPTETLRPPQRRALQWRLISHLLLNHLSLLENAEGVPEALQEILQLYNFSNKTAIRKQISGITGIKSRKIVRQIGGRIGMGFVRGVETQIEFDEKEFVGAGIYLFSCVLDHFLGLYVSLNSFNELVVTSKQREGVVKRFAPRAGANFLI